MYFLLTLKDSKKNPLTSGKKEVITDYPNIKTKQQKPALIFAYLFIFFFLFGFVSRKENNLIYTLLCDNQKVVTEKGQSAPSRKLAQDCKIKGPRFFILHTKLVF